MTCGQLKEATGSTFDYSSKLLPYINDTCIEYNMVTSIRQLCFLAQVGHESGGLYYTEEIASGAAYEGRKDLGNTQPGDGVRFKGRGLIQVTGRTNYALAGVALKIDAIDNPSLLGGKNINACIPEQLKYAALSAGWFWNRHALNLVADKISITAPVDQEPNLGYFMEMTRIINGGYNGLADRLSRYKRGVNYFV